MFTKGMKPWNKGISHSPETCRKMSEIRKLKGTSPLQLEHLKKMREKIIGYKHSAETRNKISESNKGKVMSEEAKIKIKEKRKFQIMKKGFHLSEEHKRKISKANKGLPSSQKGKPSKQRGKNHWNWKGGINPINDSLRKSLEMKLISEACLKRDFFTCKECGKVGGRLETHHIKPFSLFPELRFALDNLVTLCKECHSKTDTYAGKVLKYKEKVFQP
jgi:5-methylcytosine-specific restriction endonuclease McrA